LKPEPIPRAEWSILCTAWSHYNQKIIYTKLIHGGDYRNT
jgi:hypothetical protein